MKGATGLPCVSTVNAPNNTIMNRIGSSQNVFRTRMNRQSSAKNDIALVSSELVAKTIWAGPRRLSFDPVAHRCTIDAPMEEVLPHRPAEKPDRHNRAEKQQDHDDRLNNAAQQQAQAGPQP